MASQATLIPPQQLIDAAKAPLIHFNEKKWDAVRASITPDFVYDEIATRRQVQGADKVLEIWRGWATAFPDCRATFHGSLCSGSTVMFELTWSGTHQGPLHTPGGAITPTGRRIEVRACAVMELAAERPRLQRHYFDMVTLFEQLGARI
jgi:predicted ester cyclase